VSTVTSLPLTRTDGKLYTDDTKHGAPAAGTGGSPYGLGDTTADGPRRCPQALLVVGRGCRGCRRCSGRGSRGLWCPAGGGAERRPGQAGRALGMMGLQIKPHQDGYGAIITLWEATNPKERVTSLDVSPGPGGYFEKRTTPTACGTPPPLGPPWVTRPCSLRPIHSCCRRAGQARHRRPNHRGARLCGAARGA
jgi:hypothetical protein